MTQRCARVISGAFLGLVNNRALRSRCSGVGHFSPTKVTNYGIHGVIARASGVAVDLRLGLGGPTYAAYGALSVRSFVGRRGDCYDRFVVRARELLTSYKLLGSARQPAADKRPKTESMEAVIMHFKASCGSGSVGERGLGVSSVEGPKGCVTVSVINTGGQLPHRLHVRSPVAHNLHLLDTAATNVTFADFVATFCSLDVVLGEIDR